MREVAPILVLALVLAACGGGKKTSGDADADVVDGIDVEDGVDVPDGDIPVDGTAECGNGIVEDDEECDDGDDNSDVDPDACREDCLMAHCGDGVRDTGEGCDDGDDDDTDECRNNCSLPTCGDSTVDEGEDCDDGDDDDTDECLSTCVDASCGDGFVWAGEEECDDRNHADGDGCDDCSFSCHDAAGCDDTNACTDDDCIYGGNGRICDHADRTGPCDDGDDCTDPDVCSGGTCVPGDFVCDCTMDDDCDPFQDGNLCNGTYFCDVDSFCKIDPSTIIVCDPSSDTDCTINTCDPTSGTCSMVDQPAGTVCVDGDACNIDDECDGSGVCAGTDVGLTDCSGTCVDLLTDADHCGGCSTACLTGEVCVGGSCVPRTWTGVGGAVTPGSDDAVAHAIGNDGAAPFVAFVLAYPGWEFDVLVRRWTDPSWVDVGTSLVPVDRDANEVVDIDFDGATPYVIYHAGWNQAHVKRFTSGSWSEVGAPGFTTLCMNLWSLDLALDTSANPHLTFMGAGGCGIGVGYAWYDGAAWQHHPSTAWPGSELITMNGGGMSDIAYTDRAYVAMSETSVHRVWYWDTTGGAWAGFGSTLDENVATGWEEASAITSDSSGNLWVAWCEEVSSGGDGDIYVKRWNTTDWSLVGTGAVSGTGDARNPNIVVAGTTPYLTWQEDDGASIKVHVAAYTGGSWGAVGTALNNDLAHDAVDPDITAVGSTIYVAFREDDGLGTQKVFVKSF